MKSRRRYRSADVTDAALVLDGHSRAALETLQSLGHRGIAVDLASEKGCLADKSRYCRHRLSQPKSSDPDAFAKWLEMLIIANQYRLVVPSTENSLRCLMGLPDSHFIRRLAVLPSNEALEATISKQRTWELAISLGIPVPMSRTIGSKEDMSNPGCFPVVLKPVSSLVAVGGNYVGLRPIIVSNRKEWTRALDRLLPLCAVLEQEYVPGRGVGIECLYRNGSCVWYFQHERIHELPITGGASSYRRSSPIDKSLLAMATRLLDSLKWHGVAMVEFKGSVEQGFRLMEINPRLWGSLALAIDAGVDFPIGLWSIATDKDPGPQPNYRWPYYTRNIEMDLEWLKENMRADHSDPLLLTKPRIRSLLEWGRLLVGRESWDHFDIWDWRIWSHMLYATLAGCWRTAVAMLRKFGRPYVAWWRHRQILAKYQGNGKGFVRRILFVCYGNICRSPLAEYYMRKLMPDLEVASAGFHETVGRAAPDWFQDIAGEFGVDLSASRSKRIDCAQVEWAQLVLLADMDNLERFNQEYPQAVRKATLLGLFSSSPCTSIKDPYSLDDNGAMLSARAVLSAVEGLVAWCHSSR